MAFQAFPVIQRGVLVPALSSIIVLFFAYRVCVIVYRLRWHPLARVPGPRLAACTNMYGAFYDLILGGRLCQHVAVLHEMYGPAVRIAPNEVHIKDLESHNKIFRINTEFCKAWDFYNSRAIEQSMLNILDTPSARRRRGLFARSFSRDAISKLEPKIHAQLDRLLAKLKDAGQQKKPANLTMAFHCLTADIVTEYAFDEDFGGLASPDFMHPGVIASNDLLVFAQWGLYFRKIFYGLDLFSDWLPDWVLRHVSPIALDMRKLVNDFSERVQKSKMRHAHEHPTSSHTVFGRVLSAASSGKSSTPDDATLKSDALLMWLAGTGTTANALIVGTYAALRDSEIRERVMHELRTASAEDANQVSADRLYTLPYLTAFVKEALRLSYGAPGRLPRVVPPSGHAVGDTFIPSGSIVSHSNFVYHMDPKVFPAPEKFCPERWLQNDVRELDRNLHPFSKGTRARLGIHLGMAEIYLTFARLLLELDMKLWNTSDKDMEWRDYSTPIFNGDLKIMADVERSSLC